MRQKYTETISNTQNCEFKTILYSSDSSLKIQKSLSHSNSGSECMSSLVNTFKNLWNTENSQNHIDQMTLNSDQDVESSNSHIRRSQRLASKNSSTPTKHHSKNNSLSSLITSTPKKVPTYEKENISTLGSINSNPKSSPQKSPELFSPGFTHVNLPLSIPIQQIAIAVDNSLTTNIIPLVQYSPADEEEMLEAIAFISTLPEKTEFNLVNISNALPPKLPEDSDKLTLVLDLDETLVHCSVTQMFPCDLNLSLSLPGREDSPFNVSVRWRPYLFTFLQHIKDKYEIIVFTASQKIYADALLDVMDPTKTIIKHRLFREACRWVNGNFIKDLDVLGRDLSKTIIVDNAPQAYGFHLSNGYPISGWYDDPNDQSLFYLLQFLEELAGISDVRKVIRSKFPLHQRVFRYKELFIESHNHAS